MKKISGFRKITALVLALTMLVSCFWVYAEDADNKPAAKIELSTSEYAFLDAMGMLSDKPLYSGENITRADFSYVIARLAGYKGGDYKSSKTFMDVKDSAYYCDAVNYLYDMDVVRGSAYRIFVPDSEVTFNEVSAIAVRALGYEQIAYAKYGDTPLCYVRMADYLKLFEGVNLGNGTEAVSTEDAVVFLKNTALAPTAQIDVYGGESSEFVFDKKNTLLYVNYGIAYDEGIVYDNGLTTISGPSALNKGAAVIGDITLRKTKGEFDVSGYIGMYVEFYYDEDEDMLIYAQPAYTDGVLTLTYDELASDSSEFSHTNIVYYTEKGKIKDAKISMNASMIYNGVAYPGYSLEDLKIKSGYMTLIDNGTDNVYDIITIVEYDDRYLTSYDVNSNQLYTETGTIELDDYKNVVITDHNGKLISINKLINGSVLSVVASKDDTFIRIIDCAFKTVKGTVTSTDDDYYYIDNNPYVISYAFKVNQESKLPDSLSPVVGKTYSFLLNINGEIVKAREESTTGWYTGYCVGLATDGTSLSSDIKARIFMLDKSLFEPYLKEKIKLNGDTKLVSSSELLESDLFFETKADGKIAPIRQPIKFKLNNWGEITEIETPIDNIGKTEYNFDTEHFSKDIYYDTVTFKGDTVKAINGMYFVSNNTLIIYDPYLTEENPGFQIKDIEVLASDDMKSYSGFDNAYIYDMDASLNVGIMVFGGFGSGNKGDEYWDPMLLVVDKVSRAITEENEIKKFISGVAYGSEVKYTEEKEGIIPQNIKQGDVCRVKVVNNELKDINILESLSGDHKEPFIDGNLINTTWSNAYGPIYSVSGNSIVIVGPDNTSYGKLLGFSNNNGGTKVTIYDRALKTVRIGTWKDLYTNVAPNNVGEATIDDSTPRAYIYRRYDYGREIVVVK